MSSNWYEIRIQGTFSPEWTEWFEGMEIRQEGEEQTVLAGPIVDQAALHGLLARVRALNITLLSVSSVPPAEPPAAQRETQRE
jgi:hypothetical protein